MGGGFTPGAYVWNAVAGSGGRFFSAADGDIASSLNPKILATFNLKPRAVMVRPLISKDPDLDIANLVDVSEITGWVTVLSPPAFDRIELMRRREQEVRLNAPVFEVYFLGLYRDGKPAIWIHIRPGRILITTRLP